MIYLKLGKNATVFVDYISGLKVLPNDVVEISSLVAKSPKIKKAIAGGHLVPATKAEFKDGAPEPVETDVPDTDDITKMTNAQLNAYYEENFEVSEGDIKMFKKLDKKSKIKELNSLDEE